MLIQPPSNSHAIPLVAPEPPKPQKPILRRLIGILSRGRTGKRQEFDLIGVWPPDRNGMIQISITSTSQHNLSPSVFLEMPVEQARGMARYILERTGE